MVDQDQQRDHLEEKYNESLLRPYEELTVIYGGEKLSIFEIMQRFRSDGSCEAVIQQALIHLAVHCPVKF